MFDGIIGISDYEAIVKLKDSENITINLINLHLVFDDGDKKILGEVVNVNNGTITVSFLGEFKGNVFVNGMTKKPKLDAKIRGISAEEFSFVIGKEKPGYIGFGKSPFYDGLSVYLDVNRFFGNHFALLGNSGSGKSYAISSLIQNLFTSSNLDLSKSNFIIFDSTGEYKSAFNGISSINPNYNYRFISSDEREENEQLRIPIYLLNEYDLALLLNISEYSQLSIIEKMRKYAIAFSKTDEESNNYKNYLIAKAIKNILISDDSASHKKSAVFSILSNFATPKFNIAVTIQGTDYSKQFRECFFIENGQFTDINLVNEYISSFLDSKYESYSITGDVFYSLSSLKKAFDFLLISDGLLKNDNTYCDAVLLKAKLDKLLSSEYVKYFDVKEHMSCSEFLNSLLFDDEKKYQILNISFDAVSENLAKVFIEIISRIIFEYCRELDENERSLFHIIVDDAQRYVRNESNKLLKDYNIFENISKDGGKFGVILGIVGQSSSELSKYVVSQCSNFLLFRNNHFDEVNYIKYLASIVNSSCLERTSSLQVGNCLSFGTAFKIPMLIKINDPNPLPFVEGINIVSYWTGGSFYDRDSSESSLGVSNDFALLQPVQNNMLGDSDVFVGNDDSMISSDFSDVIGDAVISDEQEVVLGDNDSVIENNQVLTISNDTNIVNSDSNSDNNVVEKSNDVIAVDEKNEEAIGDLVPQDSGSEVLTPQVDSEISSVENNNITISDDNKSNDVTNTGQTLENNDNSNNDINSGDGGLIISTGDENNKNEEVASNQSDSLVIPTGDVSENNESNTKTNGNLDNAEVLTIPKVDSIENNNSNINNNNSSNTLAIPSNSGNGVSNSDVSKPSIPLVSFGNQSFNQVNGNATNDNSQSNQNSNTSGSVPSLVTFNNGNMALPMSGFGGNNNFGNTTNSSMSGLMDFVSNNSVTSNVSNVPSQVNSNLSVPGSVPSAMNNSSLNNSEKNKNRISDTFNIEDLPDFNLGKGVTENAGFLNLSGAAIVNADGPGNNSAVLDIPQVPSNLTLAGGMNDTSGETLSFDNNSSLVSFLDKM